MSDIGSPEGLAATCNLDGNLPNMAAQVTGVQA